jgi:hypothetical protein
MAPAIKPAMAWLYESSFCRRLAAESSVNWNVAPMEPVGQLVSKDTYRDDTINRAPNRAIVPPYLVKMPDMPTFCLVRAFWAPAKMAPHSVVCPVTLKVLARVS